jgi:hypothetical protein
LSPASGGLECSKGRKQPWFLTRASVWLHHTFPCLETIWG